MNGEERLKSISIMAKRLADPGKEYDKMKRDVLEAAAKYNCPVEDLRLNLDFTEDIDW